MTPSPLSLRLKEERMKRGLTFEAVADRARESGFPQIVKAVPWNVEHGKRFPEPASLRALLAGIGIPPNSRDYREILDLYVREIVRDALPVKPLPDDLEDYVHSPSQQQLIQKIVELEPDQQQEILLAIQRPEVLDALATLNRLYEA